MSIVNDTTKTEEEKRAVLRSKSDSFKAQLKLSLIWLTLLTLLILLQAQKTATTRARTSGIPVIGGQHC